MKTTLTNLHVPTAAFLVFCLAIVPASAQRNKGRKTFSDTTSVVAVEVPVTVIRDGAPVDDLTVENFEIVDGRKKRKITGFEIIDLKKIESLETLDRPVPIAAKRHFLMFFDLAWSRPESVVKARRAARDLVDSLHPMDLAGVAVYTTTRGADLLLSFTSDRRQLELAIETLGVPELYDQRRDPLGLVFGDARAFNEQNVVDSNSATSGGLGQQDVQDIANERILEAVSRIAAAEQAAQLNKVSAFTGNLEALADLMSSIDGRKHLVYFSEGIPSDVLVGRESGVEEQQQRAGTDLWDMSGDTTFGHTQSQNQLESMIEGFRRAGCAIQSVDIGGVRAAGAIGGRQSGEESLVSMAKDTGGDYFRNFNDLGEAMEKMLERTSVTYLLTFEPADLPFDGEYHKIKVKLVDAPRGTRLSHRAGYYAPTPYDQVAPTKRRLETAEILMSDEEGGPIELDVLAAAFPVQGQKAYVPVLLEVDGKSLVGSNREALQVEIYAYATGTETGGVYDFFVQTLGLDLTRHRAGLEGSGLKYWGHFDLPPGRYTARVMVRDLSDGRYTLSRRAVTVPSFDSSEALLLPPMFPEAPGKWMLVREGEDRRRDGVEYPFIAAGQPYIPAVKPVVPARGSTAFYLRGLNLAGDVSFAGEVMSAEGTPVQGAALRITEPTAANGSHLVTAQLDTQGVEPGEYTLIGRATDATGQPHSSEIRIEVQ